jgi:hypothetical protein
MLESFGNAAMVSEAVVVVTRIIGAVDVVTLIKGPVIPVFLT